MMTSPPRHLDVYFLLSHVRTAIPDQWVHRFHLALDLAVERRASLTEGLRNGSLYYETVAMAREHQENGYPPGARVIVPLYTREFLHQPPPEYVEYCNGGVVGGRRPHIHPVFWDANPGGREAPGLVQARSLGAGIPDYEECGLAAMCRLNAFARSYQMIIDRLADRIVAAAEHPDQPPRWVAGEPPPTGPPSAEAQFVVSVLAPHWQRWNPFAGTDGALVEHTALVARGLMLLPESVSYEEMAASMQDSPGVLLVDLWALDDGQQRPNAERALRLPPPWVSVVLVAASRGEEHDARLAELTVEASRLAGHGVTAVHTRDAFDRQIEEVVQRSRRNFLSGRQAHPRPPGDPQEESTDE